MAGVCILLRLTVAGISYVNIEKSLKNGEVPSFQEDTLPGVRISCRPHGYDLLRCPCRCLSLLIHYVAFANVTMWAGLPEPRDCGVLSIVLCVSGLENLFPGGAPLFVAHFTLALCFIAKSKAALLSCHAAVSAHIVACQIAYTLPLAPQL